MNILNTNDLFNEVSATLKKQEDMIFLDYIAGDEVHSRGILDTEFSVTAETEFGANEGIFVNLYVSGNIGSEEGRFYIGCLKTLYEDDVHFLQMAQLGAKFQLIARKWINNNEQILKRTGYRLTFFVEGVEICNVMTAKSNIPNVIDKYSKYYKCDSVKITNLYSYEYELKKIS